MTTDTTLETTTDTTTGTTGTTRPEPQWITPQVRAGLVAGTATQVQVRAGAHDWTIDEPAGLGGTDLGANPVEHLLGSLGACQVITFQVWAEKLGITVDHVDVALTGRLDLRGFLGLDPDTRPGFESIDVSVSLSGPETPERYQELTDAVEQHCPVLDTLGGIGSTTPVRTTYTIG